MKRTCERKGVCVRVRRRVEGRTREANMMAWHGRASPAAATTRTPSAMDCAARVGRGCNAPAVRRARAGCSRVGPRPCGASMNDNIIETSSWDGSDFEHFPDVMPDNFRHLSWSAKRRTMRSRERSQWQEEMDRLKSQWSGRPSPSNQASAASNRGRGADAAPREDWYWREHMEALHEWEAQKASWSRRRAAAFRIAQQRLDGFNQANRRHARAQSGDAFAAKGRGGGERAKWCGVLGLNSNATAAEIKSAFKTKVFDFHPDLHPNVRDEKMKELLRARDYLLK